MPLLGVNLGHVGFLAESERADLAQTVEWIASRDYTVEERMTIDVQVWVRGQKIWHTWALNEAAIEKGNRERMLEVVTEVDERPLTSFGCDGVVLATPTGSTAYAFSAGGPVVWPEVEALLIVPISAHALFAKPLVVSPRSRLAVEVLNRTDAQGVLWCDGRRSVDLPPGARVEVTRSATPGPAGPDAPDAVFRAAGPQVRAAHPGLARPRAAVRGRPHRPRADRPHAPAHGRRPAGLRPGDEPGARNRSRRLRSEPCLKN